MNQVTSTQGIATFVSSLFDEGRAIGRGIRCTYDADGAPEMLSIIDVLAVLCECSNDRAGEIFRDLKHANLNGSGEVRAVCPNLHKFAGAGQRPTPIASPLEILRIINYIPINRYTKVTALKNKFSEVITRAIGGDPTLAMEVMATNHAYESGMIEPDHPLQAFRTQAGKELQNKELACDPRVLEMMSAMHTTMERVVKSNEEMRIMNATLTTKLTTLIDRMHDISKTRVITPSNVEKHEVFILFNIQSEEYVPKYEYYIMKCYLEYESLRKSELVARFKKVSELRRIVHPNAGALYQVLREHAKELGIKFYYSDMTLVGASIARVLEFIDKVESERLMVTV